MRDEVAHTTLHKMSPPTSVLLKRKQQKLKKTGQFSYVMAVELVHIFEKNMRKFEFVFIVLISQRYRQVSDIAGLL